jgi:hypothetical protein
MRTLFEPLLKPIDFTSVIALPAYVTDVGSVAIETLAPIATNNMRLVPVPTVNEYVLLVVVVAVCTVLVLSNAIAIRTP